MRTGKLLGAALVLLTVTCHSGQSQTRVQAEINTPKVKRPLHTGWQFREVGKEAWVPAVVPGSVHTDLQQLLRVSFANSSKFVQWLTPFKEPPSAGFFNDVPPGFESINRKW